jgi:hypothetical protein
MKLAAGNCVIVPIYLCESQAISYLWMRWSISVLKQAAERLLDALKYRDNSLKIGTIGFYGCPGVLITYCLSTDIIAVSEIQSAVGH